MANRFIAGLNSRLLALTIARRNVRRNPLQSLLIVLVIAMPVAVGALGLTTYESTKATPDETTRYELGQTQAAITAELPPSAKNYQKPLERFAYYLDSDGGAMSESPTGGEILDPRKVITGYQWITELRSQADIKTATGQGSLSIVEGQVWAPQLEGRYFGITGRTPKDNTEVMANAAALERIGAKIGDKITVIATGKKLTVVGTLEASWASSKVSVLYSLPSVITGIKSLTGGSYYAVGSKPITWPEIVKLNQKGFGVLSRTVVIHPPQDSEVPLYNSAYGNPNSSGVPPIAVLLSMLLLVPIVLLPVAVLAGSAFSFGARRQARTLAVISSLGAQASMLRFMTIANGLVLGSLGGLLGVILGTTGATLLVPVFADGSRVSYPGFHPPFALLSLIVLSGAVIGAIVSVIPAFAAAKVDVLNTLRGVRRNAKVKKSAGYGGLIVAGIGVAAALVCAWARTYIHDKIEAGEMSSSRDSLTGPLLVGVGLASVVIVIGLLMASSWLLVFARAIFRRINTVTNYATNDLIYNRKRYTAVIASVLATSFVGASLMGIVFSTLEQARISYQPQAEANQLVMDSWPDFGDKVHNVAQRQQRIAAATRLLQQKIATIKTVAETNSIAALNRHQEYSPAYAIDKNGTPIVGAEGQQPYLMRDANYYCPYFDGSPMHDKYQALQDAGRYDATHKMDAEPRYARCDQLTDSADTFLVGTPADLRVLLGGRIEPAAEKNLASGGAVVFHQGFLVGGKAVLKWYPSYFSQLIFGMPLADFDGKPLLDKAGKPYDLKHPSRVVKLDATLVQTPVQRPTMMISPQTAKSLGIDFSPALLIANFAHPLSTAQQDSLSQSFGYGYTLEQGFGTDVQSIIWWFTLGIAFFVLASTGIALGLAQIESRADQSTLGSIGAPKRFRASVVGSQALILTLLGTVLGATVGYFFAWAVVPSVVYSTTGSSLIIPPWQTLVTVVGIPLFAASIFWVGVPSTSKYRQRMSLD